MQISEAVATLERENVRLQNLVDQLTEQLENRPQVNQQEQAAIEELLTLLESDIVWKETASQKTGHKWDDRMTRIIELYRILKPKEETPTCEKQQIL